MARSRFDICLDLVLHHEGGYVDNPRDPGGATNLGITRKTLARWRKVSPWWALPKNAVQGLERSEAARIYRASYWDRCRAGELPEGVDLAVFDFAVNSGPDRAIRALQQSLNISADGYIGPLALDAIRTSVGLQGAAGLIDTLCNRREGFLARLRTFPVFGRGWKARVQAIRIAALAMAGPSFSPNSTNHQRSNNMSNLAGYKTYLVAAFMLIVGLAQLLGVDLPSFDSASAGHLIMEALAVIFLRRGIKTEVGRA